MIINLYCDGACSGNPGPGGWAYLIQVDETNPHDCFKQSGYEPNETTNNRMEIQACIEGLSEIYSSYALANKKINIITDSQYVINTMTKGWARNKNTNLWNKLDEILNTLIHEGVKIEWHWVKGHASNPYNSMCDEMAVTAYKSKHSGIQKRAMLDSSIISIDFKHIQQFTYKNQYVDVLQFITRDARLFYISVVNAKDIIEINGDHGVVNKAAEDWIDEHYSNLK